MNEQQFIVLADLLGLTSPDRAAMHSVIFGGKDSMPATAAIFDQLRQADAAIRSAYVVHGPMEFRITVGHRDTHRAPGTLALNMGDVVQLVAHSTEGCIPVRVTDLPKSSADYYSGVITAQPVKASLYQVGNGVKFSEDQVMIEEPRAASRRRPRY